MPANDWRDYLQAAHRKVLVADFHLVRLTEVMTNQTDNGPPIEVQAYFEGVVVSVVAAVDQVAQAVNSARQIGARPDDLVARAIDAIKERIPGVEAWYREPIGRDLRRIRVRIIHYAYSKAANELGWTVEAGHDDYRGSRELVAYATSAVAYARRLIEFVPRLESFLAGQA